MLLKQGDRYVLDHNFALPAAKQPIETFSVDLDLDPAWIPPPGFARRRTARSLKPGEDFVVHAELARAAAGAPAAVRVGTTKGVRAAILATLLLATLLIGVVFYRREASLGRFREPAPPDAIDEAWLDQRLFSLLPEEAGALWDESIGAPEVTAVLARLTAEKKLETHASEKEMTMRLKAPIESFEGYEKELLEALFFGRRIETSTSAIKAHYKSRGFDPAKKIEPGLRERLSRHADFQDRSGRPPRGPTFALFLAGVALLISDPLRGATGWRFVVGAAITTGFFWGIGAIAAFRYQKRMERLWPWSLSFLFVPLFFLWSWWRGLSCGRRHSAPVADRPAPAPARRDSEPLQRRPDPQRSAESRAAQGARRGAPVLRAGARETGPADEGRLVPVDRGVRAGSLGRSLVPIVRRRRGGHRRVVRIAKRILTVFFVVRVFGRLGRVHGRRRLLRRRRLVGLLGGGGRRARGGSLGAELVERRGGGGGGGSSGGGGGGGW